MSPLSSHEDEEDDEDREEIKEEKEDDTEKVNGKADVSDNNYSRRSTRRKNTKKNQASSPYRQSPPPKPKSPITDKKIGTEVYSPRDLRRKKMKMEAHLTSGCGTGSKRNELIDGFWNMIWPRLESDAGWTKIDGKGRHFGSIYFVPAGASLLGKKGHDYYDRIKDVIDRILERNNQAESNIADKYLEEFGEQQQSSRSRRPPPKVRLDLSWKIGGKHFTNSTSRVGADFQATNIPVAGSYRYKDGLADHEQIWDPHRAKKKGVLDIIEKTFPSNNKEAVEKKEGAFVALHELDYDEAKFKEAKIAPMNGSDWSWKEKQQFHEEIFRLRKDIGAVSKSMNKSVQACMSYYLSIYKHSDDYLLLKTVCEEEKNRKKSKNSQNSDLCAVCGGGGSLLICDGCEGEYHLACLRPPLHEIPEGKWECDECVDRKFLAARDYLIQNSSLFEKVQVPRNETKTFSTGGSSRGKRKRDGANINTEMETAVQSGEGVYDDNLETVLRPTEHALRTVVALAESISDAFAQM